MTLPAASHVVPVLLALCVGGALAYYDPIDFDTISDAGSEEESPYLLHRVSNAAAPDVRQAGGSWEAAPDPRLYVLTEGAGANDYDDNDQLQTSPRRVRRNTGPSLSIVNSLDVLRQRLLLEIARRRMRQSEDQILANREILKTIGKRDVATHRGGRKAAAGGEGGADKAHQLNGRTKSGSSYSVKRGNHQQQL